MRATPPNGNHWILHIKDHFSKYSFFYALPDKTAAGVAKSVAQLLGAEFKGVLLILLKKYGVKIINGRPRHPQTQGLVEQANGVMKTKLRCWLADHDGQGWSDALPDIALGMNRQSHSSLGGKMPYEIFYNWRPRWEDRVTVDSDVQVDDIEDEVFDETFQQASLPQARVTVVIVPYVALKADLVAKAQASRQHYTLFTPKLLEPVPLVFASAEHLKENGTPERSTPEHNMLEYVILHNTPEHSNPSTATPLPSTTSRSNPEHSNLTPELLNPN